MRHASPEALSDLRLILEATRDHFGAKTAEKLFQALETRLRTIETYPLVGRLGRVATTREHPVPRYPFIIVYCVDPDGISLVRVIHGATDWPAQP